MRIKTMNPIEKAKQENRREFEECPNLHDSHCDIRHNEESEGCNCYLKDLLSQAEDRVIEAVRKEEALKKEL